MQAELSRLFLSGHEDLPGPTLPRRRVATTAAEPIVSKPIPTSTRMSTAAPVLARVAPLADAAVTVVLPAEADGVDEELLDTSTDELLVGNELDDEDELLDDEEELLDDEEELLDDEDELLDDELLPPPPPPVLAAVQVSPLGSTEVATWVNVS
jgi:hypothetical protein